MDTKKKATITELVNVFKHLDKEARVKYLWLGKGMALAGGTTYEELQDSRR